MTTNRIILAAVGQRGVTYGVTLGIPDQFVELLRTSGADASDLTRGGVIAYFLESRRAAQLLEGFFARAESLRESMPHLGIGVAQETLIGQFDWLGRLKRDFRVDPATMQRALDGIQGAQWYRAILGEMGWLTG